MITFREFLEEAYTDEQMAIANKTSRAAGSVGAKAIVPRFVQSFVDPSKTILDFGAGATAQHAQRLKGEGFKVTAYDFGSNVDEELHDSKALKRKYDVIYASNVLNTQSSEDMLDMTLDQIKSVMRKDSTFIANLPAQPRKFEGLNADLLTKKLRENFKEVKFYKINTSNEFTETKSGSNPATIFVARGPK